MKRNTPLSHQGPAPTSLKTNDQLFPEWPMPSLEWFYCGGTPCLHTAAQLQRKLTRAPCAPSRTSGHGCGDGASHPLPAGEIWGCPSPDNSPSAELRVGQEGLSSLLPPIRPRAQGSRPYLPLLAGEKSSQCALRMGIRLPTGTCHSLGWQYPAPLEPTQAAHT